MTSISILDQSPIDINETVRDGIARSVELAQLADKLNYKRYFVAEHHNMPEVVGTSPEILVTHILNHTQNIRVGSGGVMLQHYSPFKIIEQFHLISNLAPGRVDLGIGKAPGGFPLSTQALQAELKDPQKSFEDKFRLLNQFNTQSFSKDDAYNQLQTSIRNKEVIAPKIFLLGGSEQSAQLAAEEQVGFIYAYFINSNINVLKQAISTYKSIYPEGKVIVAVAAVVTETQDDQDLVEEGRTNYALHFKDGKKITVNTKSQVETFKKQSNEVFTIEEKQIEVFNGSANDIRDQLNQLNKEGNINEFMLHMPVYKHALRVKTVKQLAPIYKNKFQREGVV